MSDTEYVQEPINLLRTEPAVLAHEPEREEQSTFDSSPDGLREAANEIVEAAPEPVEIRLNDVQTGEARPANETLSAEQAGRELARYRNSVADEKQAASDAVTAEIIDHIQLNSQNPAFQPQVEQAQPEQQQHQPQPEQTAEQYPPGVDPDVARVLAENPKVREALQAEVQQVHAAAHAYTEGLRANAALTAQVIFSDFPELVGVTQEQLPGALKAMQHQNPERALAAVQRIQTAQTAVAQWQHAQHQQQQEAAQHYQREWQAFSAREDALADQLIGQTDDKLARAAVKTLTDLGVSKEDIGRLWNGEASISLRDARAQALLAKAAKYDQIMGDMKNATRAPHPPVMRPGVSGARQDEYSQSELSGLTNRLNQSGNVKDAARLLLARRANRG